MWWNACHMVPALLLIERFQTCEAHLAQARCRPRGTSMVQCLSARACTSPGAQWGAAEWWMTGQPALFWTPALAPGPRPRDRPHPRTRRTRRRLLSLIGRAGASLTLRLLLLHLWHRAVLHVCRLPCSVCVLVIAAGVDMRSQLSVPLSSCMAACEAAPCSLISCSWTTPMAWSCLSATHAQRSGEPGPLPCGSSLTSPSLLTKLPS